MKRRRNSAFTAPLTLKSPAGSPDLTLRTMDAADQEEWGRLRSVNERWLAPWESSDPHGTEPLTFKSWVNRQREEEREGTSIIFLMEHEGEIVGQISLGAIYPGPMRTGIIGYWIMPGGDLRRSPWPCSPTGRCWTRRDRSCTVWK